MSQVQEIMKNPMFRNPYEASYEAPITHEVEAVRNHATAQPKYDGPKEDHDYMKKVFFLPISSPPVNRQSSTALTQDMYITKTSLDGVKYFSENSNSGFYSPLRSKFNYEQ